MRAFRGYGEDSIYMPRTLPYREAREKFFFGVEKLYRSGENLVTCDMGNCLKFCVFWILLSHYWMTRAHNLKNVLSFSYESTSLGQLVLFCCFLS